MSVLHLNYDRNRTRDRTLALKQRLILFIFSCVPFLSLNAMAASFDCRKAQSSLEKTICTHAEISALDSEMGHLYTEAQSHLSSDGLKILQEGQKSWLNALHKICFKFKTDLTPAECLQDAYQKRIQDLKTASIRMGPFLFSRIDYFYAKEDSENEGARPYNGQTTYPRIDSPQNKIEKQWNQLVAKSDKAAGDNFCEGSSGDVNDKLYVRFARREIISLQQVSSWYCHGTPHGNSTIRGRTYLLQGTPRLLKAPDLFSNATGWQDYLAQKLSTALEKEAGKVPDLNELKEFVADSQHWYLSDHSLIITIDRYDTSVILPNAPLEISIPLKDLQSYLSPIAPSLNN
jgi:uncharacterized protein